MASKLCVFDMDGTLLDGNHKILPSTLEAIEILRANDYEIAIATGRMDTMVKEYRHQLNLSVPIISCNGAMLRDQETEEIIYKKIMDQADVLAIIDICEKHNVIFHLYGSEFAFGESIAGRFVDLERYNKGVDEAYKIHMRVIKSCREIVIHGLDVYKVLIPILEEKLSAKVKAELIANTDLSIYSSGKGLLDVMANHVSKGETLKALSQHLNIDTKDIIAFGDGHNDMDMFKVAGKSVAMSNSVPELKAIATYETGNNNEGGIRDIVGKLFG